MRTHIAKALQSHCKAIQNAVKTYNTAATQLDLPRPPINWEAVSHINFLEEFNLLHNMCQDVSNNTGGKGWCPEPVHCKYTARKWIMYPACTNLVHLKYIQNFLSQFPCN